mmetsp:Transcript_7582/g.22405  ORF Transcript_7582/g.22405 Transcript_7582/m.22405 type:complete len:86 (+) Transcript_7582:1853-2110(+)
MRTSEKLHAPGVPSREHRCQSGAQSVTGLAQVLTRNSGHVGSFGSFNSKLAASSSCIVGARGTLAPPEGVSAQVSIPNNPLLFTC